MAAGEERLYTQDELEAIFARRNVERQQLLSDAKEAVVAALQPELDRMTNEISDANHLKKEFGEKIDNLAMSVSATASAVTAHSSLAGHPDGQRLLSDLGLSAWSLQEKQALHPMVAAHVLLETQEKLGERKTRRSVDLAHLVSAGVAAFALLITIWKAANP